MSDPLDDLILKVSEEEQKKDALRSSMTFGLLQNPDERAKAQKVAKQLGTTPQAAQENLSNFERAAKRQAFDFDGFIKHTPKLSTWAANPENAAIAHDDLEVLTGLETASQKAIIMARNAATVRNRMVGGGSELTSAAAHVNKGTLGQVSAFLSAAGGAADWTAYSVGQLLNVLTGPTTLDTAMKNITSIRPSEMDGLGAAFSRGVNDPMNRYFESGMKARAPLFVQLPDGSSTYNWKEIGAYWDLIAENAPQLAVQWGASMKAFNAAKVAGATDAAAAVEAAAVARPIEWGQTVGEEFENTRRKDVPMAQGLLTSAASATAQTIVSQGIPGRSGGLDALLFERLAKSSAGKKGLAGAAQRGILGAVKEGTEEATQEGVSILGQRTYDPTAFQGAGGRIATAAIGGALVGGPMASIAFRDNVREISDLAAQSKLKARDSEAFAGFMKEVGGEAFIDANRLTTFFQENGIDPVQGAEMVGARNYAEAMVAGTDAVVSVADLVSKLKPEQVSALADDLRVAQGELSAREVEDYQEQSAQADLAQAAEPAEAGPRQIIAEQTYRQLVDTGMAPRVAEVYADRHARVMENLAKDYGQDPITLNERYGLRILRVDPGVSPTDAVLADGAGVDLTRQTDMDAYLAANPELDPLFWQGDKLTERLAALRQRLTLESGASDGTDLQAQREPRTEGSPDAGGTPGLGGEVPAAAAGGATLRVASAQDANARIDWLSSPEGVAAQNKAPHVYEDMPDVTFKSWDGAEQTYTVSVQGRDVFLDAPVVDGKPRGGISLEVTPDGDLYVRIIHNGDLKGAGLFLYQEGIKAAMAQFPEVTRDSMVFGDTSDLAIAAREKVGGTDVFENPMGNKVSETPVRNFLDYQPDQLLSRLKAVGIDPLKATDAEISAKLAENPADQVFFQGPVFYSALQVAIPGISKIAGKDGMVDARQAESWLAARQKEGKFKQAELDAVGLPEFLALQKGKVSVADIEAFVKQNGVHIQEVMKGEGSGFKPSEELETTVMGLRPGPLPTDPEGWVKVADRLMTIGQKAQAKGDTAKADKFFRLSEEATAHSEGVNLDTGSAKEGTKYGEYQLPGGTDYRELLLALPNQPLSDAENNLRSDLGLKKAMGSITPEQQAQLDALESRYRGKDVFKSNHWDEPNILSHIRFNTRTDAEGRKVLFIEEIQSDWGQKGKKEGFADPEIAKQLSELETKLKELQPKISKAWDTKEALREGPAMLNGTDEQKRWANREYLKAVSEYDKLEMERTQLKNDLFLIRNKDSHKVPSAPFVTDTKAWVALSIKRMIRYAAENGFDRVAFVNGEQSADRYDLSKSVSRVVWSETSKTLKAMDLEGNTIIDKRGVEAAELEDYIGKEAAQKLIDTEPNNIGVHQLDSDGLKVGGEGMKAFYDKIVPSVANDVLKKLGGGKVGEVVVPTEQELTGQYRIASNGTEFWPENSTGQYTGTKMDDKRFGSYMEADNHAQFLKKGYTNQLGFDITPEMKAKVVDEGQTLFQPGDGSRAARMSERMKKLSRTTRAAMDKNMASEFLPDEAAFAEFDESVKEIQAGDVLDSKRGFIQFSPDRKVSIGFLEKMDLTTFIHETGHMYLEVAGDLAQENPDSEGAQQYAKILSFLDVADRSELTRDHHEKFATAMEAYAMEGKAPTPELKSAFQRVKYWMLHVYRSLSSLSVKLNDDIRGVFDRMLAGEEAVAGAERSLELKPMFANAEDMTATQAEYEAYAKMAGRATMTAREAVEAKLMRELMREREAWWKEETAKVAEEVAAELQTAPGYVALRTLTQGEDGIKLSKQALLDAGMTQEELNTLPRSKSRVYGLEGGMDLQAAAEMLGFPSGNELLTTLRGLKPFKERVKEITEARMKSEHGDLMTDGSLTDEAIEAVHNGHYADLRMAELRVLERMRRQAKPAVDAATKQIKAKAREAAAMPPIQSFRDTAVEIVERTAIRDLQPHRYLQARVKASQEASKAYTKLDFEAAAEAKHREILNHFLYLEASKARDESTKVAEYARRATDKKFLQRMGKAGGDYLNQWLNLAGRYDFTKMSKVAIEQGIQDWAKAREAEGIIIDPMLFNEGRTKNWREVPVVELRAIHDALVNIETVARRARMVLAGEKQVDFDVAVHDLTSQAYGNFKTKPLPLDEETRSLTEKALSHARKWNVDLLKFEEIVDRLDKGDINGPWRRYIFEPMALAQYREFELNRKMTLLLNEAMEEMPKKMRRNLTDEVTLDGIGTVSRKFLVSMALNTGNDSNQAKMLKGMGWADPAGMEKFGKALDKLTREEWVFIQKTWDALESLWPEIAALEKRMTGLEPAKVDRTPFTVRLGDGSTLDMQGGYYPVSYDPKHSGQGAMQADADIMSAEGMFKGPVTFKGHTKERVENFAAPLLFDFEQVLSKHVPRVVKDLSHREAAMSVAKLLRDQEVRQSVQETIGPEYEAAMMPWLQGTVNDPAGASTELTSWLGKARSNLVVASLAFRASSVLVQVMDPMRSMVGEHAIKPQYLLGATAKLSADLAKMDLKTVREVRAMSGEMAGRAENLDRDLRSMWRRNLGKDGFYAEVQRAGMKGLAVADAITSTVVWLGAYDQAIAEGSPKAEAVSKADRVVRLKLMTGAAKDLTRLQRSPDMASKLMTTYMGDAVSVYGMLSRSVHNVANGEKVAASAFAFLMAGMILPVLADMVKGKMPKDDEEKAAWALKKAAFGLPSSIPLVRDVAGSIESGYDYSFSPIASQIAKIPKFAKKYSGDKDVDEESLVLDLVELIGGFSGIPGTGQAMTTLRYLKAVDDGKKPEPETKAEKAKNAILGAPGKGK